MTSGGAVIKWRTDKNKCAPNREARMALLKKWANIVVVRQKNLKAPRDRRSLSEVRAAYRRMWIQRGEYGDCWVCRNHALMFNHHVIQLQNGGSNWHLNIVKLCDFCHCEIHPWMKPKEFEKEPDLVALILG